MSYIDYKYIMYVKNVNKKHTSPSENLQTTLLNPSKSQFGWGVWVLPEHAIVLRWVLSTANLFWYLVLRYGINKPKKIQEFCIDFLR